MVSIVSVRNGSFLKFGSSAYTFCMMETYLITRKTKVDIADWSFSCLYFKLKTTTAAGKTTLCPFLCSIKADILSDDRKQME